MRKIIKFMLEDKDEYVGKVPYEIIEYRKDYNICQVEVKDISEIVVVMVNDLYRACEILECADGNYVNAWERILRSSKEN